MSLEGELKGALEEIDEYILVLKELIKIKQNSSPPSGCVALSESSYTQPEEQEITHFTNYESKKEIFVFCLFRNTPLSKKQVANFKRLIEADFAVSYVSPSAFKSTNINVCYVHDPESSQYKSLKCSSDVTVLCYVEKISWGRTLKIGNARLVTLRSYQEVLAKINSY